MQSKPLVKEKGQLALSYTSISINILLTCSY